MSNSNLSSFPVGFVVKDLVVFPVEVAADGPATLLFVEVVKVFEASVVGLPGPDVLLATPVAREEGLLGVVGGSFVDKAANALLARLSANDEFVKPLDDMMWKSQKCLCKSSMALHFLLADAINNKSLAVGKIAKNVLAKTFK